MSASGDPFDAGPGGQVTHNLDRAPDLVTFKCPSCDGDGYNDRWLEDDECRDFPVSIPCERCGGTGELRDDGEDDPE